ncbi:hypothetical protein P8452_53635 [Trifolium repens]|nr:hypothetical protein P8452_53635 [Trifolium repens]
MSPLTSQLYLTTRTISGEKTENQWCMGHVTMWRYNRRVSLKPRKKKPLCGESISLSGESLCLSDIVLFCEPSISPSDSHSQDAFQDQLLIIKLVQNLEYLQ